MRIRAQFEHAHDSTVSIAGAPTTAALSLSFARADDDNADENEDDDDDADDDAVPGDNSLTSRKTSSAITDCNCAGVADADSIEITINK